MRILGRIQWPQRAPTLQYCLLAALAVPTILYQARHATYVIGYLTHRINSVAAPYSYVRGTAIVEETSESAERAGLKKGDIVVSIDGNPNCGPATLIRALKYAPFGSSLAISVRRSEAGAEERHILVPLGRAARLPSDQPLFVVLTFLVLPTACVALGLWVCGRRPWDRTAWVVLGVMLGFSQTFVLGNENLEGTGVALLAVSYQVILLRTWPLWLLLFAVYFPSRLPLDARYSWVKWCLVALLAAGGGTAAACSVFSNSSFAASQLTFVQFYDRHRLLFRIPGMVLMVFVFAGTAGRYFITPNRDEKRRLRLLICGTLLALGPITLLSVTAAIEGKSLDDFSSWIELPCLMLTLLFPATLTYVIVVEKALDVSVVIRQGVQYALTRGGVTAVEGALTAGLLAGLSVLVGRRTISGVRIGAYSALGGTVILGLTSLMRRLGPWVDRRFFREAYDTDALLLQIAEELRTTDPAKVLETSVTRISESLHVSRIAAFRASNESYSIVYAIGFERIPDRLASPTAGIEKLFSGLKEPAHVYLQQARSWVHLDPAVTDDARRMFRSLQTELLLPIESQRRVLGVLSLGPKRSEEAYSGTDVRALKLVATQIAAAIENSELLYRLSSELVAQERIKADKEAAEKANQAKSAFIARMSHELRTPMNAIIGYSEMLIEDADADGQAGLAADLKKINSAGKHLLELINAVLDISKIEAGKMEVYIETFSLRDTISDIVGIIQPLVEKNHNRFAVNTAFDAGVMASDRIKLRQILFNLLSNACKFTQNGEITLTVSRHDTPGRDWLTFRVADTGIGMTAEQREKLFKPFSQADAQTSNKFGGTGLGLYISRTMAEMLGGRLTVESEYGKGTAFTMELPDARGAESETPKEGCVAPSAHSPAVLVIDDDPVVHDLMRRMLGRQGYRTETATSGTQGLVVARQRRPAAIILDILMPDLDGWQVLAALKSDPELCQIPVIVITIVDDRKTGIHLGASEFLLKPVTHERLSAALARHHVFPVAGPSGGSALVVDDDDSSRRTIRRLLEQGGWRVREAEHGRDALASVAEEAPQVILLDLMMPEMDGFSFLDHLRSSPTASAIPVIVITAKDLTSKDRERLTGVATVIEKRSVPHEDAVREVVQAVVAKVTAKENAHASNTASGR